MNTFKLPNLYKILLVSALLIFNSFSFNASATTQYNVLTNDEIKELNLVSLHAGFTDNFVKNGAKSVVEKYVNKIGGKVSLEKIVNSVKNDNSQYNYLSKDQKKAYIASGIIFDTNTVTNSELVSTTKRGYGIQDRNYGPYCGTVTTTSTTTGALGNILFKYTQQVYRCYNGSTLTSSYRQNRWGETSYLFWQFAGHTGNWERGGQNTNEFAAWTQGTFQYCIAGWGIGCVQYKYPWIEQHVFANGGYSTSIS
jgi:hypothetical protein